MCDFPICRVFLISAQNVLAVVMDSENWATRSDIFALIFPRKVLLFFQRKCQ